ncbi:MAG: polysaccharide deacetylase family protein [Anaerolineales bacterium]|jgi:peptidoglycan/xylan/chitin deacetylase (PgdA/CDA1 family)
MFAKLVALIFGVGTIVSAVPEQVCTPATGVLEVPILLYHHVASVEETSRFTVRASDFDEQMKTLAQLGYETITPSELVAAIQCGERLPDKPIMITFDDGHADVYRYAYPSLERHGFKAAMYVVTNRTQVSGFLSIEDMKQLLASGWEIGSHTITHPDLSELKEQELESELDTSRQFLEEVLGVEISSLAYPFGGFSSEVARAAVKAGYTNAMGLGVLNHQSMSNRYYLNRREVDGDLDIEGFLDLVTSGENAPVDR